MSTTVAWSPAVGTSADDAESTTIAAAAAAAAAVPSCCGPVATTMSRGGSPVAAALAAAHGALNERRLVVTGAPDPSALAGARAGTTGVTLRTKKHKDEHQPLEIKGAWGKCCSPQVGEAPLPLPQGLRGATVAPAGASAALARSSTDNPVVGAYAPATGANSTATSAAVVMGVEDSTSRGGVALLLILLFR
jgi:hypothetical protein